MSARDEMVTHVGTPRAGMCPRTCRDTRDGPHAHDVLDRIASLATNPETAPVVFRWLVEAGVLQETVEWCRRCRDLERPLTPATYLVWGKLFPPEAQGPRCADHLYSSINPSRIDQYAVLDLRPLYRGAR